MITSVRQPTTTHPTISVSYDTDEQKDPRHVEQTDITGILYPLVAINGKMISPDAILSFTLIHEDIIPEVEIECVLSELHEIIATSDKSTRNARNTIQVQIIPPTDGTYKKANIEFLVTTFENLGDSTYHIQGSYYNQELVNCQFKCLGDMSTYQYFDYISQQTGLGYCTNITGSTDTRNINLAYKTYVDSMRNEISIAQADQDIVLDCWVDLWDNINLIDMRSLSSTVESEDKNRIYVTQYKMCATDGGYESHDSASLLTNLPLAEGTDIYLESLTAVHDTAASVFSGNVRVLGVYTAATCDCIDHIGQDTHTQAGTTQYEYLGEVMGNYNYLLSKGFRSIHESRLKASAFYATVRYPNLGLIRGKQVRITYMYTRSQGEYETATSSNIINEDDAVPGSTGERFAIHPYSGNYLIIGIRYTFDESGWVIRYLTTPIQ